MSFSDAQIDRYARHLILKEIGGAGQQKLLAARVLVVGAGGLGAPVLLYLAAAGVGTLGIVDFDTVDLSNLQRQIIHDTDNVGMAKTESAAQSLARVNPDVKVVLHNEKLDAGNARALISQYDIVADGTDSFATRFIVNDACVAEKKPLVSAAVGQFDGQLATWRGYERDKPCYRCFMPEAPPPGAVPTCEQAGVLGALTGVMGSLQALEVIKEVLALGESMAGRLLIYDALGAEFRTVRVPPDPECAVCGKRG
ncbi:MAG: molybdopterin-synthase adenylyltransferase MoeB [Alphaproteobacteria bacterium]|nr:MAG: molybdopterin-synthase adenylyltransferase MoeB [Alphaproteobacteria bacterium]